MGTVSRCMAGFAAIALLLVAGAPFAEEPDEPPSSLEPGTPRGKVTFIHTHRKITACEPQTKGKDFSCRSKRQNGDTATKLRLKPITDSRKISGEDKRRAMTLKFASSPVRSERAVEIGVGDWELVWGDKPVREPFRVANDDKFKVWLRTVSGECKEVDDKECVLVPEARHETAQIPPAHRVR